MSCANILFFRMYSYVGN